MKNKKMILTLIIAIAIVLLMQAHTLAYQSTSKGAPIENRINDASSIIGWALGIRQMEASGAGLGLNETTLNTTTLLSSETNNIDVHLQKNTEYGAMVILGASNYGKQGDLTTTASSTTTRFMHRGDRTLTGTSKKASSTGNVYGVYELGYENVNKTSTGASEWVAAGNQYLLNQIAPRYINRYTNDSTKVYKGDATIEGDIDFSTWHHGNEDRRWISNATTAQGFVRAYEIGVGSVFYRDKSSTGNDYYARAVIVNGVGF